MALIYPKMTSTPWATRPARSPDEPPLFPYELIDAAPHGASVLDAGCGPGSWDYSRRPDLRITGFDIKFPPGPPARRDGVSVLRAALEQLPLRAEPFDLTVCHYVLEHVTGLRACCDELARVTKPEGTLYLSVPRAAAFDDRLYRFAGYFAKYALMKFKKRIEHQQRFDFADVVKEFTTRGFVLTAFAHVPAGFSWMNDPRTKPLQGAFTDALAGLHRATGIDLAVDANFVLAFRKTTSAMISPAIERRVTHVCRECGEHSVLLPPVPTPKSWNCPWCGKANPLGRAR
jgi:SAM-dependent methyltransferase